MKAELGSRVKLLVLGEESMNLWSMNLEKIFGGLCMIVLSLQLAQAETRAWKNIDGVEIKAEFVKVEGEDVTLKLPNGKQVTFAQSKLSEEDRAFIKTIPATPAKPETTVLDANRKAKEHHKMSDAQEEAKKTGLPILAVFTGTSWCPYCVKLEKEVFSKNEFKEFANQNLVLLVYDFAAGGKSKSAESKKLSQEFGVSGFPTYFLVDADGKRLATNGYMNGITPEKFAQWVKQSTPQK